MNRFYSFNDYCRERFGEKVYRLSLNAGMGCPNRDGTKGIGGCAFCSAGGSGDFAADSALSIAEQIEEAKARILVKSQCKKFVAYFQAYTNTYAPVEQLRALYEEAIRHPDIAALSIATRSDCLPDDVVALLVELNRQKPVWVELGLQTIHDKTLHAMNTGTCFFDFKEALSKLHAAQIPVIAHLILGLPGESPSMMKESVAYIATSGVSGVKLSLLHVLKDTALAKMYEEEPFPMFSLEEYADFVVDCVEMLPPDMVIHRLTGDGPKKLLIAPLWSADKKRVLNTINRRFADRDSRQGKEFCYG